MELTHCTAPTGHKQEKRFPKTAHRALVIGVHERNQISVCVCWQCSGCARDFKLMWFHWFACAGSCMCDIKLVRGRCKPCMRDQIICSLLCRRGQCNKCMRIQIRLRRRLNACAVCDPAAVESKAKPLLRPFGGAFVATANLEWKGA